MTLFQFAAVFLSLVTLVGWVNVRVTRLPTGVAMLGAGVLGAASLFALQATIGPFWGFDAVRDVVARLNFTETVLGYLLAFLMFAGGMHVDLGELRRRLLPVWTLATAGVLVSIALVGFGVHAIAGGLGIDLPLPWAFVFASLISPTDPVAVLDIVRTGGLSRRLAAVLQGEALFNDGVGIVAFTTALAFATHGGAPGVLQTGGAILLEAGGGLAIGWLGGRLVVWIMKGIDDHVVEATASLALAAASYALAQAMHLSGPIAAAAAGVVVGSYGIREAMSDRTQAYVQALWTLIDEILSASLFLLLGLQIFVLRLDWAQAGLWVAAAVLVTVARLLVVVPWGIYFHVRHEERGPSLVLAWGGMRGALSVALALSIPKGGAHDALVAMTFAVVALSVLFQGLTFGRLAKALHAAGPDAPEKERHPSDSPEAVAQHVQETMAQEPSLAGRSARLKAAAMWFANPARFMALSAWLAPLLGLAALALLAVGLTTGLNAPPDYQQGETVRIMFVHVPAAITGMAAYLALAGASFFGLVFRHSLADAAAKAAAPLGAAFTFLGLVTGSLWGRPEWGTWWVWDARLTSFLILFLIYLAYMALHAAFEDEALGARMAAILGMVGVVMLPIIFFSVTWWNTLHQGATVLGGGGKLAAVYRAPFWSMWGSYLLLFASLWMVRTRAEVWRRRALSAEAAA